MKIRNLLLFAFVALTLFSCSKDDEKPNTPPKMADQAFTVAENISDSQIIGTVTATDTDEDALAFEITTNDKDLFEITEAGALSLASGKSLDFNTAQSHQIMISVSDGEDEATTKVTITVTNVNSGAMIDDQTFTVSEDIDDTEVIGTVVATDEDGDALVFSITTNDNGLFEITEAGVLSLADSKSLDFNTAQSHEIMVSVTDGEEEAEAKITITVTNVNSSAMIDDQFFTVSENIDDTEEIGTVVATDEDGDALVFSITTNDNGLFEITEAGVLSLAQSKNLDYENGESHTITVQVDDGNETATADITITVTNVNDNAPEMADQAFTVDEDVDDITVIGAVEASDADNDELVFNITINDNDLFEITGNGELSLAGGQQLDFETKTSHSIRVSVSDGENEVESDVEITVNNVIDTMAEEPESFVTTWNTQIDDVNNKTIKIYTNAAYTYDYTIDWGDNTDPESIDSNGPIEHEYNEPGRYTVAIQGDFPKINMNFGLLGERNKLESIDQWGAIVWKQMDQAFDGCLNLVSMATDGPDLSEVTDCTGMFYYATSFNGNIGNWDVINVTDMGSMFAGATSFDQDLSSWDVSNVHEFGQMFYNATSFDQSLGDWDISSANNMTNMLRNSGLSKENYGATLVGWAYQDLENNEGPVPEGITLGAHGLEYCQDDVDVGTARNTLSSNPLNWIIQEDSGTVCQ